MCRMQQELVHAAAAQQGAWMMRMHACILQERMALAMS